MKEKLIEIVSAKPLGYFWLGKKEIIVHDNGQKYKITSISVDKESICIINFICNDGFFVSSSFIDDLSQSFIAQLLSELL